MKKSFSEAVEIIMPLLTKEIFKIPIDHNDNLNFPSLLKSELNKYADSYEEKLNPIIDRFVNFDSDKKGIILEKIKQLCVSLTDVIDLYFQGKIFESIEKFNKSLDDILFSEINTSVTINKGFTFYRARQDNETHFTTKDLFHIKFEDRIFVTTKRYSIPGFPALYLGESSYVCWEEFERIKFRNLWFSKFQNTKDLNIIVIERLEDFLVEIEGINKDLQLTFIARYLVTFPLSIACSIKVKNPKANFRPEYIIPQLLLQYVSKDENFDGIKFPSTKINYSKLKNIPSYNYVFPVKSNKDKGYCDFLIESFCMTEPTSLEIEEVINNPHKTTSTFGIIEFNKDKYFELIDGVKTIYGSSSFGKIEKCLDNRELKKIFNS